LTDLKKLYIFQPPVQSQIWPVAGKIPVAEFEYSKYGGAGGGGVKKTTETRVANKPGLPEFYYPLYE